MLAQLPETVNNLSRANRPFAVYSPPFTQGEARDYSEGVAAGFIGLSGSDPTRTSSPGGQEGEERILMN